jgi:predicted secreted Zn-dependent protease
MQIPPGTKSIMIWGRVRRFQPRSGKEIDAAVLAVKPASNCEDLATGANAAAEAIVAKYQALDAEYDRKTDHGRSQGAVLL